MGHQHLRRIPPSPPRTPPPLLRRHRKIHDVAYLDDVIYTTLDNVI
jgi:hypothetical protein